MCKNNIAAEMATSAVRECFDTHLSATQLVRIHINEEEDVQRLLEGKLYEEERYNRIVTMNSSQILAKAIKNFYSWAFSDAAIEAKRQKNLEENVPGLTYDQLDK